MKYLILACSVALGVSVFPLPIGYYTFLRILIMIGAVAALIKEYKLVDSINLWVILFGVIAILFNPFLPVYLGSKSIWMVVDLASAVVFVIEYFRN